MFGRGGRRNAERIEPRLDDSPRGRARDDDLRADPADHPLRRPKKASRGWGRVRRGSGAKPPRSFVGRLVYWGFVLAVWGYAAYRTGENEKAQYALFEGMNSFRAYTVDPKSDGLSKAEGSFEKVAGESSGGLRDIARLYLAKIAAIKGMKEQAGRLYAEINKKPANDVIKKLSEIGLQESGKKE